MGNIFVGLDPGGRDAFGWVVVNVERYPQVLAKGECSDVMTVIAEVEGNLSDQVEPVAVGIDAPLYWVYQRGRLADDYVRKLMPKGRSSTVISVNSLRGACLVQGVLAAKEVKQRWAQAKVTEAHPKALFEISREARKWIKDLKLESEPSEHIRDAALAAFAAYAYWEKMAGWINLVSQEGGEPFFPSGYTAAYYFPEERNSFTFDAET